ncbi:hypothetical protein [Pseudomonas benzenivorans]
MDVKPTERVDVAGIGGLGHLVTALTSSPSKQDETKRLGAHRVVLDASR